MFGQDPVITSTRDNPLCFDVTGVQPRMSNDEYHSRPEYSSSFIKNVASHSVGRAIYELEKADSGSQAFTDGSAFHEFMETGILSEDFAVKPDGMNFATTAGKAWKSQHEGKQIILENYLGSISGMRDSIMALEWFQPILRNHKYEFRYEWSFFADGDDEHTKGLKFRIRPDLHIINPETEMTEWVIDWKSAEDIQKLQWRKFFDLGYDVQAVFYSDVIGIHPSNFVFICVEKKPPYAARPFMLSPETIKSGRSKLIEAIGDIRNYNETGEVDINMPEIIYV